MKRGGLAVLPLLLLLAAGTRAELVRSEGEGSAPLAGAAPTPRAAALQAALADAVLGVAEQLAGRTSGPDAEAALRAALAPDPARFAQGYRELEASERPGPEGRALVVRVEARVDASAVADALRSKGLLAARPAPSWAGGSARLVIEPLPAWPLLGAVRKRLVELGARHV